MSNWYKYDVSEVALEFGTDIKNGKPHVSHDRKRRGDNNIFLLPAVNSKNVIKELFSDASFVLLAVVYALIIFTGRYIESALGLLFIAIAFFVSLSIKIASSKRIANSYRLLTPNVKVVEGGKNCRLSVFDVEVGDLIEFSQGDIIPADARIVDSEKLIVAERYIDPVTGKIAYRREEKHHDVITADEGSATYANLLYAASMVVSGKGRAIVTETGDDIKYKSVMRLGTDTDSHEYFSQFFSGARRSSLFAFFAVIPLTILSLVRKAPVSIYTGSYDLLYAFLLFLALSVTCMSELIISPADFIVTKELLISSRKNKAKRNADTRITKLSSAETIADIDTLFILSPEVLVDSKHQVRRIYFADKQYRFDALKSEDLSAFFEIISPIVNYSNSKNLSKDLLAVKSFLNSRKDNTEKKTNSKPPRFLRNYPTIGSRACVFESDSDGKPINYTFYTSDLTFVEKCSQLRTEGGGIWKLEANVVDSVLSEYSIYEKVGLSPVLFITSDERGLIFEGMIGIGVEYPFTDASLAEEFLISGIQPILFLDKENENSFTFANECGLLAHRNELAVASEYIQNGMDVTDAPLSTRIYIGFDRKDVSKITERLIRNGRRVLPIIKDSADRRGIAPLNIYATHATDSYDSVKIASSLTIQPADSEERCGGAYDALKMIRGASIARLKLGIYRNYLAFSMFLRAIAVSFSILFGKSGAGITSLMILSMGFVCDAVAVTSIMMSRGIPVKPKEASADAKTLFASTLFWVFSVAGGLSGIVIFALTEFLLSVGQLSILSSASFLTYSVVFSQVVSMGGFLFILNKRTRRRALNWIYLLLITILSLLLIVQNYIPENMFKLLGGLNLCRIDLKHLPFIFLGTVIPLLFVFIISKVLSSFSSSRIK